MVMIGSSPGRLVPTWATKGHWDARRFLLRTARMARYLMEPGSKRMTTSVGGSSRLMKVRSPVGVTCQSPVVTPETLTVARMGSFFSRDTLPIAVPLGMNHIHAAAERPPSGWFRAWAWGRGRSLWTSGGGGLLRRGRTGAVPWTWWWGPWPARGRTCG